MAKGTLKEEEPKVGRDVHARRGVTQEHPRRRVSISLTLSKARVFTGEVL